MTIDSTPGNAATKLFRTFLPALLTATLFCNLGGLSSAAKSSHLLDGTSFIGKNGEQGQDLAEYEDEEIVFQDGMFTSVSCVPYNFGSGPYTARRVDGRIHFSAVTKSQTHGTITWQGIIDGDHAEVTFVWTKKRWYWDTRREYWFNGIRKK